MEHSKKEAIINKIYTDAANPGGYSGFENLYLAVKLKHPEIKRSDVRHYLEGSRTYTLFRDARKNFRRSKTIPMGFMTNLQVDLAGIFDLFSKIVNLDFQKLAKYNDGYRYCLLGVDVLSRRVFGTPIKSKVLWENNNPYKN